MRWLSVFRRDKPDDGSDADRAVERTRGDLHDARSRRPRVRKVAEDLEELRKSNGFAEGFYRIFRDEGGKP